MGHSYNIIITVNKIIIHLQAVQSQTRNRMYRGWAMGKVYRYTTTSHLYNAFTLNYSKNYRSDRSSQRKHLMLRFEYRFPVFIFVLSSAPLVPDHFLLLFCLSRSCMSVLVLHLLHASPTSPLSNLPLLSPLSTSSTPN